MAPARQPSFYISHGGGPAFWIDYPPPIGPRGFVGLKEFLQRLPKMLPEPPKAWLVVSAHWETPVTTVSTAEQPEMLYDYYGFPDIAYTLQYPAAGSPEIAARVRALLDGAGIGNAADNTRGIDHGVFVPMMMVDPQAGTPLVMLSLQANLDPARHLAVGRALAPLRDEGVVIIGSGSSFHNLRTYFDGDPGPAMAFDNWLVAACLTGGLTREAALRGWEKAPSARACHPREEHLLPLMVAAGAGGSDQGHHVYRDRIGNKAFSGFAFGEVRT